METLYESIAQAKDINRIESLMKKADGNTQKQVILAANMCKAIKDESKMARRYDACVLLLGKDHPVTKVFADAAIEMGIDIDPVEITDIKSEDTDKHVSNNICTNIKSLINLDDNGIQDMCNCIAKEMSMTSTEREILKNKVKELSPNGVQYIPHTTEYITDPVLNLIDKLTDNICLTLQMVDYATIEHPGWKFIGADENGLYIMPITIQESQTGRNNKYATIMRKTLSAFKVMVKFIAGSTKFKTIYTILYYIPYTLLNKYC